MIKLRVDAGHLDRRPGYADGQFALQVDDGAEVPITREGRHDSGMILAEDTIVAVRQSVDEADLCLVRNVERRVRPLDLGIEGVEWRTDVVHCL